MIILIGLAVLFIGTTIAIIDDIIDPPPPKYKRL